MTAALDRSSLIAEFHTFSRPRDQWLVGVELERHLLRPDGTPVPYFGEFGVQWLLDQIIPNGGKVKREGENAIAIFRDKASITLEPGSQWEFSTSPFRTMREVAAESSAFTQETAAAIGSAPITQVALGYTPWAPIDSIPWVPKGRYVIMRDQEALPGELAHNMMKGTCAVQASFDFENEADAARKVGLGIRIGPLTTALFANSPLSEGKPNGYQSFRGHVWTRTDPRRSGFPEAARAFTFERWVDYLLDVPMMFIFDEKRGWLPAHGMTFRTWMTDGFEGLFPDAAAWDLHLTSVFPEVRIKRLIEVRGADCVNHDLAMAFGAFFSGLFYDENSLDGALAIGERLSAQGSTAERFATACREGLGGVVGDRKFVDYAADLFALARDGLARWSPGDVGLLEPLAKLIESGESPAASVLRAYAKDPRPEAMVEFLRYQS